MSEESIFREVHEELRRDRMHGLWRRFGPWVIGVAVLIVVVVAANEGWTWWRQSTAATASDQIYAAFELAEKGDIEGAKKALTAVEDTNYAQYPELARFREAGLDAANGDEAGAVALYDELASNLSEKRMRELALVLSGFALVDEGNVTSVASRVGEIAGSDSPLRNSAREALGLTQYASGDLEAALSTFQAISSDAGGSMDQLRRIQVYIAQLQAEGAGATDDKAAASDDQSTDDTASDADDGSSDAAPADQAAPADASAPADATAPAEDAAPAADAASESEPAQAPAEGEQTPTE